jgi:hypothetical protein
VIRPLSPARPARLAAAFAAAVLATACTTEVVGHPTALPAVPALPGGSGSPSGVPGGGAAPTTSPAPAGPACVGDRNAPVPRALPARSPQRLPLVSTSDVAEVILVDQYRRNGGLDAQQELTQDGFAGGRARLWQTGQVGQRTWRLDSISYYVFRDGPAACHFLAWLSRIHHLRPVGVPGVPGAVGSVGSAPTFSASEVVASTGRFVITGGALGHGNVVGFGGQLLRATYRSR